LPAVALCIGLFAFWCVLGYALVTTFHAGRSRLQDLLISPAVGLVVLVAPLFTISRLGVPVRRFGIVLGVVLLVAAVAWLWRRRPGAPWRRAWPYGLVLVVAMLAVATPMRRFGFDWLSYCNDDMANYALAGDRLYWEGYWDDPKAENVAHGKYYGDDFWFLHVATKGRPGSELVLAWLRSVTGLNEHQTFMPLIVSFHLGLLLAAAALVRAGGVTPEENRDRDADDVDDAGEAGGSGVTLDHGELRTPSPLYAGERAGVRGFAPAARVVAPYSSRTRPLTLTLSPEYRGEGTGHERRSPPPSDASASGKTVEKGRFIAVRRALRQCTSPAVIACGMLALSALIALGTLYQLIAQVAGLMLLAATAVLLLRPFAGMGRGDLVRHSILLGISGGGLLIVYPEVVPFLALAWLGYLVLGVARRRTVLGPSLLAVLIAAAVAAALTRTYAIDSVTYLLNQVRTAAAPVVKAQMVDLQTALFPYYLLPEGLGDFWGFLRIARPEEEPWNSIKVAAGAILLLLCIAATVRLAWRGRPVAFVAGAMWLVGGLLFKQRAGFGLFKLAMYLQPFAVGVLVILWFAVVRGRRGATWSIKRSVLAVVPLAVVAWAGLDGQRAYVEASAGIGSAFLEIPDPSRTKVASEFRRLMAAHPSEPVIISDTYNLVLAKLQALYTRGRQLAYPSRLFFQIVDHAVETHWRDLDPRGAQVAEAIAQERAASVRVLSDFDVKDPKHPGLINQFFQTDLGRTIPYDGSSESGDPLFIKTTPRQSLFNRRHFAPDLRANYLAGPYSEVRNHLIFVSSELGPPYYVWVTHVGANPTLYQLEEDPLFFHPDSMAGVGRYLLLQAINPSPKVRLMVELTCSYAGEGHTELPPMAVVGRERTAVPISGHGSMRIVSPPIEPQDIRGRKYLMIDMGTAGWPQALRRTGLMNLYGKKVSVGKRLLVGYARDVSLLSEEQYQAMAPPSRLDEFPNGKANPLRNRDIEYSGLYEDGWASEDVMVRLTQPALAKKFVIKGSLDPRLAPADHKTAMELSFDGQAVPLKLTTSEDEETPTTNAVVSPVTQAVITPGEFTITGEVPTAGSSDQVRTIRIRFTGPMAHLEAGDDRPISVQFRSLGFDLPPSRIGGFRPGNDNPVHSREFEISGIWEDGWMAAEPSFRLTQPAGMRTLVIQGHVPKIDGSESHEAGVEVLVDDQPAPFKVQQLSGATTSPSGGDAGLAKVRVGAFAIRATLPATTTDRIRRVRVRFHEPLLRLPQPDTRSVAAQLSSVTFEAGPPGDK
jgi:hypothetical protein